MILGTTAALIAALIGAQPAPQVRDSRTPQVDQTVAVTRGTRLLVNNFAGEVILRTWDKDSVHLVARHSARSKVTVRPAEGTLSIVSTRTGPASVDYDITVPVWMGVKVEGDFNFVKAQGLQGEFSAETVRGDIVLRGGTGFVTVKSVQGEVSIDGARGKITASSVNEGITITNSSGEIVADTTNGDIRMSRIESGSVQATSVNGDIFFEGAPPANGRYQISTHNGDIIVTTPENASVTFNVRTYQGDFSSALPTKGPPTSEARGGRRVQYTLGSGSAEIDLETFGGEIQLRRPGSVPPKTDTGRKSKVKIRTAGKEGQPER